MSFIEKHIGIFPSITIEFFGGEPLLEWKNIVKVLERLQDTNIHFKITTNGLLLTQDKILFLQEKNVSIILSITAQNFPQLYRTNRKLFFGEKSLVKDFHINYILDPDIISFERDMKIFYFLLQSGFSSFLLLPAQFTKVWGETSLKILKSIYFALYKFTQTSQEEISIDFNSLGNLYQKVFDYKNFKKHGIEYTIDIDGNIYRDSESELYLIKDIVPKEIFDQKLLFVSHIDDFCVEHLQGGEDIEYLKTYREISDFLGVTQNIQDMHDFTNIFLSHKKG